MIQRLFFGLYYLLGKPPWDTGITPPEVVAAIESRRYGPLAPGRALDLGCGTGTNSLYLARRGWQVTGVDFVPGAVRRARRKARAAGLPPGAVDFRVGDVTDLRDLRPPYHLALDVGCFHALPQAEGRRAYVRNLTRLLAPNALVLLYAFEQPESGSGPGLPADELLALFAPDFLTLSVERGSEAGRRPSAWYTFRRLVAGS
ncbi:MAG: class I SAM-dependent methyltransferase [Chloroflexi bacterium]|nr:class I SAM-dependent methyltransferase [Chloroflexota bacterium]